MKLGLIVSILSFTLVGCWTNDNEALKALDDQGFSEATITERGAVFAQWEGCGNDDGNWYHAIATNPHGKRVNVLICCGGALQFKGCVVRSK